MLEQKIARFRTAVFSIRNGELDVEADGPCCSLHFYGGSVGDATNVADLDGKVNIWADECELAEAWTEQRRWFTLHALEVACRSFDATRQTIVIVFQAQVQKGFGCWEKLEGSIRCTLVDRLR